MNMNEHDTVTIPKSEYDKLVDDSFLLYCLEHAGVDNWDGYEEAMIEYHRENEDE